MDQGKITAQHLSRRGYVYVRQSTNHQVVSNTESTLRQYALRDRLVSLGWDASMVEVIDSDLGMSGKTSEEREGFQRLISEVANGKVGAIASIEASRLSRSSSDWTRLIEFCTITNTLIIDADGIYDPGSFNDRLLLGLKGTMSEAELHLLMERMRGGLLNKAKRGDLKRFLPIGYDYDLQDKVVKTSNIQVRQVIDLFFERFRVLKTAYKVVQYFEENDIKFPVRMRQKVNLGNIMWVPLVEDKAVSILHNPFYCGMYIFGRTQMQYVPSGKRRPVLMPEEKWHANIENHHEGYITKEEFEMNQAILQGNCQPWNAESPRHSAPREGEALLQGICFCGKCGNRMYTGYGYNAKRKVQVPRYQCKRRPTSGSKECHEAFHAKPVDDAVSRLVVSKITPEVLAITANVYAEVIKDEREHLTYFKLQVEDAQNKEHMARIRYMSVDPQNRLVAMTLEANWNETLRKLEEAKKKLEEETNKVTKENKSLMEEISYICNNFSTAWGDEKISNEDRKRLLRYIISDVTLLKTKDYKALVQIRFQGGASEMVEVQLPRPHYMDMTTPDEVIKFLEKEADNHPYTELADLLNQNGYSRECERPFTDKCVFRIMKDYNIKSMKERYLEKGWITAKERAKQLGISTAGLLNQIRNKKYKGSFVKVEKRGTVLFPPDEAL